MIRGQYSVLEVLFCAMIVNLAALGSECDPNRGDDPNGFPDATIVLTSFDVNGTSLELHQKTANKSERSIWICDGVNIDHLDPPVETYLTNDPNERNTLHFRRRLDVPTTYW